MIRKFAGAVAAALAALAGLWLMIAPFALGAQPENADWTDPTKSEFFTGLGVAVVGLAGAVAFALAIREELVARGLVTVRPRRAEPEPEPVPAAPQTSSADLAALLAPLVEALREDLNRTDANRTDLNRADLSKDTGEHRRNGQVTAVGVEEENR